MEACSRREEVFELIIIKIMIRLIGITLILFCTSMLGCKSTTKEVRHVFYLHGSIIETQGINAISERFGKYDYQGIINTLKNTGAEIHSEIRTEQTTGFDNVKKAVKRAMKELD